MWKYCSYPKVDESLSALVVRPSLHLLLFPSAHPLSRWSLVCERTAGLSPKPAQPHAGTLVVR